MSVDIARVCAGHGQTALASPDGELRSMAEAMTEGTPLSEAVVAIIFDRYPRAEDISPTDFERLVRDLLEAAGGAADSFEVVLHSVVQGDGGDYDFDATATFEKAGMAFLVLVEAKRHKARVKREYVQVLQQKKLDVHAHKAILFSASGFQLGAIEYAKKHRIALATVHEGRMLMETRSQDEVPPLTPEQARSLGIRDFEAFVNEFTDTGTVRGGLLSPRYPDDTLSWLIGSKSTQE